MAKENPMAPKPTPRNTSANKSGIKGIVAKGKQIKGIKRGTK